MLHEPWPLLRQGFPRLLGKSHSDNTTAGHLGRARSLPPPLGTPCSFCDFLLASPVGPMEHCPKSAESAYQYCESSSVNIEQVVTYLLYYREQNS